MNQRKLTSPLVNNKKAGSKSKKAEKSKNIDKNKVKAENKSITLRTSPRKIKKLFTSNTPARNNKNRANIFIPEARIKKVKPATMSIAPSILTSIKTQKIKD